MAHGMGSLPKLLDFPAPVSPAFSSPSLSTPLSPLSVPLFGGPSAVSAPRALQQHACPKGCHSSARGRLGAPSTHLSVEPARCSASKPSPLHCTLVATVPVGASQPSARGYPRSVFSPSPRLLCSAPTWLLYVNACEALHTPCVQTEPPIPTQNLPFPQAPAPAAPCNSPNSFPPPCHPPPTTAGQPLVAPLLEPRSDVPSCPTLLLSGPPGFRPHPAPLPTQHWNDPFKMVPCDTFGAVTWYFWVKGAVLPAACRDALPVSPLGCLALIPTGDTLGFASRLLSVSPLSVGS